MKTALMSNDVYMDYFRKVLHEMVKKQVRRYFKPYIEKAIEESTERIATNIDKAMRIYMVQDARGNKLVVQSDVKNMPEFWSK